MTENLDPVTAGPRQRAMALQFAARLWPFPVTLRMLCRAETRLSESGEQDEKNLAINFEIQSTLQEVKNES